MALEPFGREPDSPESGTDLHWIINALRHWWLLILGSTLLGGIVAYVIVSWRLPDYEARTTLLIQPTKGSGLSEYNQLVAGELLAFTYSQIATGQPVLEDVISQLDLLVTTDELVEKIKAEPVRDTQLIRFLVKDPSPDRAALIAKTLANVLIKHVQDLNDDRYTSLQENYFIKLNSLSSHLDSTLSSIDLLNEEKIENEVEESRLIRLLEVQRNDYRYQQQILETLKANQNQVRHEVTIVEPANTPNGLVNFLSTATVTLLFNDEELIQTYAKVVFTRPVLEAAIAELNIELSPDELEEQVSVTSERDTRLIYLSVKDDDAERATRLANTIARVFISHIQSIKDEPYKNELTVMQERLDGLSESIDRTEAELNEVTTDRIRAEAELSRSLILIEEQRDDYRVTQQELDQLELSSTSERDSIIIVEPARIPVDPVQYNLLYILLAASIGAIVASGIAFLLEYLDDTIRTKDEIRQVTSLNLLSTVGNLTDEEQELVVFSDPRSGLAESFRVLATNIQYASIDKKIRSLLVTSPQPLEGKSFVAANLAAALAQKEQSVVLVDADLRLPRLHHVFGFSRRNDLANSLLDGNIDGNLQTTQVVQLRVLGGGTELPNPTELVGSSKMRKLIEDLSQICDLVLIDSPPVLPFADAAILATLVDGVILVFRHGQTRGQPARQALERLRQVHANLLGVVLNAVPTNEGSYGHYRYYNSERNFRAPKQKFHLNRTLSQIIHRMSKRIREKVS